MNSTTILYLNQQAHTQEYTRGQKIKFIKLLRFPTENEKTCHTNIIYTPKIE